MTQNNEEINNEINYMYYYYNPKDTPLDYLRMHEIEFDLQDTPLFVKKQLRIEDEIEYLKNDLIKQMQQIIEGFKSYKEIYFDNQFFPQRITKKENDD